ncbi:MAG: EF-hand domain-containing protein [Proteobacteria bacterium]|nr:EF-hand domain-containing protein [Pseudomonadota bacterium]
MSELSKEEILEIQDHFEFFDNDHSGQIDESEFIQLFKILAPSASTAMAKRGFEAIDLDHNQLIDFNEFLDWWKMNWTVY